MAKTTSTSQQTTSSSDRDRTIAKTAYNEALPYNHPDANYGRAVDYRRQIADGQARSGR